MKLRPSDPAYSERLAAFLLDVGHRATATEGGVELDREIPDDDLWVYLRVWSVLEPEIAVNVDRVSEHLLPEEDTIGAPGDEEPAEGEGPEPETKPLVED